MNGCDLITDYEKYFNRLETMSLEIATSIQLIQLQLLQKSTSNVKANVDQRVMIWKGTSSKSTSDIYVHKSKQTVNQEIYLKGCIDKKTIAPNIIRMAIICSGLV